MRRSLIPAVLVTTALLSSSCGVDEATTATSPSTSTSAPSTPSTTAATSTASVPGGTIEPPAEGTLVTWSMAGGECSFCAFSLRLDADGTAVLTTDISLGSATYDATAFRRLLDGLDPAELVTGTTDCGREVDGNAPTLTLHRTGGEPVPLDSCHLELDSAHPVLEVVLDANAAVEAVSVDEVAEVTDSGGLCPEGPCSTTTSFYADGTRVRRDQAGSREEGTVSADDARRLTTLVDDADRDALVLGPFTDTCPRAHDGSARTYVIGTGVDALWLDECREVLDHDAPVLVLLDRLVARA